MDLLTELLGRADFRVEEPRVHTLEGSWAEELPRVPLVLFILRGQCSVWPEGERHSRGLSDGHLLLTSGASRCTLQRCGPRLDETRAFEPQAGRSLDEPVFRPTSDEHIQLLAAVVRWSARPFEQITLPSWVVAGPDALSLRHDGRFLHEALAGELRIPRLGRAAVIQRLLEAMVIRALRGELLDRFWTVSGWLGAFTDPVVRTALGDAQDLASVSSVRALAEHSHRSVRRLSARVKRISGVRPGALLCRLRMAGVLQALEDPAPCLTKIARVAGFATVPGLCRAFRREIGCSPAEYWRRRNRRPFLRGVP